MGGICSMHGELRNLYNLLGNSEGKKPHKRPSRSWENNIKRILNRLFQDVFQ